MKDFANGFVQVWLDVLSLQTAESYRRQSTSNGYFAGQLFSTALFIGGLAAVVLITRAALLGRI